VEYLVSFSNTRREKFPVPQSRVSPATRGPLTHFLWIAPRLLALPGQVPMSSRLTQKARMYRRVEVVSPCSPFLPAEQDIFFSKDSSLRAEMDRILEFSRTVGLCNYATSSKQHVPGPTSLVSRLDSEPQVGVVPLISL